MKKVKAICGPTGSGKSDIAHLMAVQHKGVIINADAMQIYKELPLLTASPTKEMQAVASYYGYNFLAADEPFSAGLFASYASMLAEKANRQNHLPIIVGGSGMYISYLLNGYSSLPQASNQHRDEATRQLERLGVEGLYQVLLKIDPNYAGKIDATNKQRLVRAYEVYLQTGKSLLTLQQQTKIEPLAGYDVEAILLLPERSFLRQICTQRLRQMFANGAIDEVKAIEDKIETFSQTAQKIIGLAEIHAHLQGNISKDEAFELTLNRTMQYAKRQSTFFRHQFTQMKIVQFASRAEYELATKELQAA